MTPKHQTRIPQSTSLTQQIRVVEQRLLRRRAASRLRLARCTSQLRESITSPLALLLAAAIGFALGPSTGSRSAASSAKASRRVSGLRLLPAAVSMLSMAGSMMSLWQRFKATSHAAQKNTSA